MSPNKNLKSLFILRCCITKVTRKGRELREGKHLGKHMFGLSLFRPSWQSNPVKNISTSGEERIEYTASLGEQGQSNALSQGQQRQSNPHPMPCLPPSRRHNIDRCLTLRLRDFFFTGELVLFLPQISHTLTSDFGKPRQSFTFFVVVRFSRESIVMKRNY